METKKRAQLLAPWGIVARAGCILAILSLSACVVPPAAKRIAAFSTATSLACANTTAAFENVEKTYYQMQVVALVVNYDKVGFNPKFFEPLFSREDLEVRARVLEGLQQYAQKLAEIMSDKHLDSFDEQTKAFGQSLVNLKGNPALQKIAGRASGQNLNVLTAAIDTLGHWFIDYKRQKGVRKIVLDMRKPVQEICSLFIADMGRPPDASGLGGHGLRDQLWIEYDKTIRDQAAFVDRNRNKLDPRAAAEEIGKLAALLNEYKKADQTLQAAQATLEKLAETHNQLVEAFDKASPTLDTLIRELINEGQRVKKFYEELAEK